MKTELKPYTLSMLVKDTPGVVSQVSRLFSRKGYNIDSMSAGGSKEPDITRMTFVVMGDELMINQIAAQCRKLLPVLSVKVLSDENSILRELTLVKVQADARDVRDEVMQIANIFRANIIDISRETLTIATFGNGDKVNALLNLLADFGIIELVRTGTIAIERGHDNIYDNTKIKEEYNYGKNVL